MANSAELNFLHLLRTLYLESALEISFIKEEDTEGAMVTVTTGATGTVTGKEVIMEEDTVSV